MSVDRIEGKARRVGRKLLDRAIILRLDIIAPKYGVPEGTDRRLIVISREYDRDIRRYSTFKAIALRNRRERAVLTNGN